MPNGTIVRVWSEQGFAFIVVRVEGDGPAATRVQEDGTLETGSPAAVEYRASVPLSELAGKSAAQQKSILQAAVRAVRDGLAPQLPPTLLPISGTVSL